MNVCPCVNALKTHETANYSAATSFHLHGDNTNALAEVCPNFGSSEPIFPCKSWFGVVLSPVFIQAVMKTTYLL